jgi:sulfite reductase (NADPH) flavoprotein alpha-component
MPPEATQRLPRPPLAEDVINGLRGAAAGLTAEQLVWASGYLAGLAAAGGATQQPTDPATVPAATASDTAARLTILYGSQTGNGRALAQQLEAAAARKGIAAELVSMADYPAARLKRERLLAIVVSTHGEGEPPDDAMELHRFISGRRLPALESLSYWVLALGDSSYENFCQTGRDFDRQLESAGARRMAPLVECDLDFTGPAASWTARVLEQAAGVTGRQEAAAAPVLRVVPAAPRHSKSSPFPAPLIVNQRITGLGSSKDVRHLELDIAGSGLHWEPGDSLGVVIRNPERVVEPVLETLGFDGNEPIAGSGRTLREEVSAAREITALNRPFLEAWAAAEPSGRLRAELDGLRDGGLGHWLGQHQLIDVLRAYRAEIPAEEFVAMLRPLPPRQYSIASAPEYSEDEIHLTVALLQYEAHGAPHWGAGSSWLALDRQEGDTVPVYVETNERFRLPGDDVPVIMIGPGTGVAPFRAFLQAREARGAQGGNWLVFGDRNFATDFLYQIEWLRYRKQGLLSRLDVAFSRDHAEKRYVQHRLREFARELFAWLEDGACLYVCGDAKSMAPDVDRALREIIATQSGRDEDGVEDYFAELRRAGRYQRDVY